MKIRPVGAELFHADGQTDGWTDGHHEADRILSAKVKSAFSSYVTDRLTTKKNFSS
jgi:hypothetical protein